MAEVYPVLNRINLLEWDYCSTHAKQGKQVFNSHLEAVLLTPFLCSYNVISILSRKDITVKGNFKNLMT